jgi:hypothetical protein
MEIGKLLKHLGQSITSQKLLNDLLEIGINPSQELILPDGEYRAYIERSNEGLSFVFTDEAIFLGKADQAIGKGDLYFSGVFLYAEGKDGYKQFVGNMPMNLSFENTRDEIVKYLGKPSWNRKRSDGSTVADRWDNSVGCDYRIHITYLKSSKKPVLISLNIADKEIK